MKRFVRSAVAVVASCLIALSVCASMLAATIETVPVGNPGNATDTRYDAMGVGAVDDMFNIGKYEVTAGQ